MYADHEFVRFEPFVRQADGAFVTIGRLDTAVFLTLPVEALEILDDLASGKSVGEARQAYAARYGEEADVGDLLSQLEKRGFVLPPHASGHSEADSRFPAIPGLQKFHFEWIPQRWAELAFGRTALAIYALITFAGLAAAFWKPEILPGRNALLETENLTAFSLFVSFCAVFTTFLHELGHVVGARAAGISSRVGFGNRLWILVAETDMTGVWSLPPHRRFLPILAGPIVDLVSAAMVLLLLFARATGWLELGGTAIRALQASFWIYLLRLLWQCYFFLRTDFYFVLATATGCRNLMGDTEDYLRAVWARLWRRPTNVDQSHIPRRELGVIHFYAWVWGLGRAVFFGVLLLVQIPLLLEYSPVIWNRLTAPTQGGNYRLLDNLAFAALSLTVTTAGIVMWLRELRTPR